MQRADSLYLFGGARHPRLAYGASTVGLIFLVVAPAAARGGPIASGGAGDLMASAWTMIALALAAAALAFRGRFPRSVAAATLVLYFVGTGLGGPVVSHFLGILIAVFSLARRTDRRTTLIAAGAVAALTVAGSAILLSGRWVSIEAMIQIVALVGFAAATGDATRSRHEFIEAITERARHAEETKESEAKRRVAEERLKIARDLHDVMAHHIAVINLHASVASGALKDRPEDVEKSLVTIRQAARTVLSEIGGLLAVLRRGETDDAEPLTTPGEASPSGQLAGAARPTPAPARPTTARTGSTHPQTAHATAPADAPSPAPFPAPVAPIAAPVPGLARLDELLADFRQSGLEIDLRTWGEPHDIPEPVDVVAYRIIQEALTNAHKHGADRSALLNIDYSVNGIEIIVTNTTSDTHPAPQVSGHGLVGVRERIASVEGTFSTSRGPGPVYRFTAWLPFPEGGRP